MNSNKAIFHRRSQGRAVLAALSLAFTALSVAAVADSAVFPDPGRMRVVSYDGLNLDRQDHAALLFARIKHAAIVVCNPFRDISLARNQQRRECTDAAIADAVARVNHPNLTAYYEAKTRFPAPVGKTAKSG